VLREMAQALQQSLAPAGGPGTSTDVDGSVESGTGAWSLPFQDAMLRQYMTRCVTHVGHIVRLRLWIDRGAAFQEIQYMRKSSTGAALCLACLYRFIPYCSWSIVNL